MRDTAAGGEIMLYSLGTKNHDGLFGLTLSLI